MLNHVKSLLMAILYSRGLKSEQFSWMWINRLRKSRHDRVTAGSQQSIKTQGDCLHLKGTKYQITYTREPTPRTADYSSASTTLHYKQSFCQNGLIWEGVKRSEQRKQWKEKKWKSVRKKEKKIKEGTAKNTNENKCWKYTQLNDPQNDPRTTPRTTLIHELSNGTQDPPNRYDPPKELRPMVWT